MRRSIIGSLLTCLLVVAAALSHAEQKATTFSADVSGLWFVPSESGWGLNIIQQSHVIFATLFVYGLDGKATWYVGSNVTFAGTDSAGAFLFSGPLYQTTGPYFGTSFNPSAVDVVQVGTITLRFPTYRSGQLTYSVNGTTVTKSISPQTWVTNNLSGVYLGGAFGATASCGLPLPQAAASLLAFNVVHNASGITITVVDGTQTRCVLTGGVTQYGKLVDVDGTYLCSNGGQGAFGLRRLEAGIDGLTGAYVSTSTGCSASVATIGAARVQ